ncbi:MAG TPA: hypothetical protein VGI70_16240, partial [Polyangiales bacterium]
MSAVALEIADVRIFSYSLDPLLVYSAISLALLGLGAGGILVSVRPALGRSLRQADTLSEPALLSILLSAFAVLIVFAHALFARSSDRVGFGSPAGIFRGALPVFAILIAPYLVAGVGLSVVLTRHAAHIGRVYAMNLAGSALGGVAIYPLLRPLGAERVVAMIALTCAGSALLVVISAPKRVSEPNAGRLRWPIVFALSAVAIATLATIYSERAFPFAPDPKDLYGVAKSALAAKYPTRDPQAYTPVREFSRWDPVSKIEIYRFPGDFGLVNGVAPVRLFAQDGGAGSMLVDLRGRPELERDLFEGTVYGLAYALHPQPDSTLIIGLGGAPDILSALHHHSRRITGVELNQTTIDVVRATYAEFLGWPYQRPNVEIVYRDGRAFIEQTHQRYDVLQMTGADTYAAGASGAFMFSESYLYTSEAFDRYWRSLRENGVMSVIRFGFEAIRVIATACDSMRRNGVKHPERHIIVVDQGIWLNVLVSREELSRERVDAFAAHLDQIIRSTHRITFPVYDALGFGLSAEMNLMYAPGRPRQVLISNLIESYALG